MLAQSGYTPSSAQSVLTILFWCASLQPSKFVGILDPIGMCRLTPSLVVLLQLAAIHLDGICQKIYNKSQNIKRFIAPWSNVT